MGQQAAEAKIVFVAEEKAPAVHHSNGSPSSHGAPMTLTTTVDSQTATTQSTTTSSYLEPIMAALRRIKDTAVQMSTEVQEHNQVIDTLDQQVEHTDARLGRANERATWIYRQSTWRESWTLTMIAVALFMVLIVLMLT